MSSRSLCRVIVIGGLALSGLALASSPPEPTDLHEQRAVAPAVAAPSGEAAPPVSGEPFDSALPRAGRIPSAVEGEPVKFCPVGGESYPAEITYCPEHGVELKPRN